MRKAKIKVNEYFIVLIDEDGEEIEVIFNPPLLAESSGVRVELRKERNHNRPHLHIIKKGKTRIYDVSIALDELVVLAGKENLKYFAKDEYKVIMEFIVDNQDRFKKIYNNLRVDL